MTLLWVNLNKMFIFYKVLLYKINLYINTNSVFIQGYRLLDSVCHLILMKEHKVAGTGSVSVLMSVTGSLVGASLHFHLRTGTNAVTKMVPFC
jgi:hypothetical protein